MASLDAVSVKVDYTVPSTVTLTVDADGNTTAKGSDTFSYDQPNRLKSATVAGQTETYSYDGDGVRLSRTVGANPAIRYVSDVRPANRLTSATVAGQTEYQQGDDDHVQDRPPARSWAVSRRCARKTCRTRASGRNRVGHGRVTR